MSAAALGDECPSLLGRRVALFGLPACMLVYLLLSLLTYDQIEEDAYIYFRLADNLASGHGYVFNRGGPPVESGTSPLWQLLIVGLTFLPLPIVTAAKFLGITCGAVSLALTARLAAHFVSDPVARLTPVLLTATSVPFVLWSHRGLETPLFTAAVLWVTLSLAAPAPSRRWILPAAVLFLARPEGAYILLALVPFLASHRERLAELAKPLFILAAIAVVATAVRLAYFHDLVPQTFYVKMTAGYATATRSTRFYFASTFLYPFAIPLLASLPRRSFWSREKVVLLSVVVLLVGWNLMVVELKPHFRHVVPLLPLFYIACVSAFEGLVGARARRGRPLLYGFCAAFVIVVAALPESPSSFGARVPNPIGQAAAQFLLDPTGYARATGAKIASPSALTPLEELYAESLEHNYQALVGKFLNANYPDRIEIVYDQMGQTPYFAGADKVFIDSFGIADKVTGYHRFALRADRDPLLRLYRWLFFGVTAPALGWAARPYTEREALDYVFAAEPDLIMINRWVTRRLPGSLPALIGRDRRLRTRYARRAVLADLVVLYEKKDARTPFLSIPDELAVREY